VTTQKGASPARCGDSGEARSADQSSPLVGSHTNASRDSLQIFVSPTLRGRKWRATLASRTVCIATAPLITSARILISEGADPNCIIEMWHVGALTWALRGELGGVAATLMDGETASGAAKKRRSVRFLEVGATTLAGTGSIKRRAEAPRHFKANANSKDQRQRQSRRWVR
jgi:hypothetical protein